MNKLTIRPMMELLAPTAATAAVRSAPVKLPTTAISEALNSCSSMAVAATGRAKRGILFQMGPCSISSCRFCVLAAKVIYPFRGKWHKAFLWQSLYNGFMLQCTINIATCFSNFEKQVAMELSA